MEERDGHRGPGVFCWFEPFDATEEAGRNKVIGEGGGAPWSLLKKDRLETKEEMEEAEYPASKARQIKRKMADRGMGN